MHVCARVSTRYVCACMSVQLSLFCVSCMCRYRGQAGISRGHFARCLARNSFLCLSGISVKTYPSPVLLPAHLPMNSPNHLSTHPLTSASILPPKHFYSHPLSTIRPTYVLMVLHVPFNSALSTIHPPSTCPSTDPSTHHPLTHPITHWPLPTHSSTQLIFSWLSMHPSTILHPPPTHHPIHLPIYPPNHSSNHLSTSTIHPPIHLCTHPYSQHPPTIYPPNHPSSTTH